MKETPLIMSTPMVRAYLDGKKTNARRVIKPQPQESFSMDYVKNIRTSYGWSYQKSLRHMCVDVGSDTMLKYCPYGQVGDRLWVKETLVRSDRGIPTRYAADGCPVMRDGESIDWPFKKSPLPSLFMPRWVSRITVPITGLRVERLQEITNQDIQAEGIEGLHPLGGLFPNQWKERFKSLWNSLNAKRGYPWESNPWVWVIEFPRCR